MNRLRRSCLMKRPYLSETEALEIIKQIVKAGRMPKFTGMTAYKCEFCPHWHVGHPKKKKKVVDQRPPRQKTFSHDLRRYITGSNFSLDWVEQMEYGE